MEASVIALVKKQACWDVNLGLTVLSSMAQQLPVGIKQLVEDVEMTSFIVLVERYKAKDQVRTVIYN